MPQQSRLLVRRLTEGAVSPKLIGTESGGEVGFNLFACLAGPGDSLVLAPWVSVCIGTGYAITVPPGTYGRITGEAHVAGRTGLYVTGGFIGRSTIAECEVSVINLGNDNVVIQHGQPVAQLVIIPVEIPVVEEVESIAHHQNLRSTGDFR